MGRLKFKLTIAYDGAAYEGWQPPRSGRGVKDFIDAALARIFRNPPSLESSSRTDAGVHALGLVAHIELAKEDLTMPPRHLALAINACLPEDIRILSVVRVPTAFHARFDATGKQYRYHVWNHPVMNPLLRGRSWHVPAPLDLAAMRQAAELFPGRKDFRAFTSRRDGVLGDPVRTLTRCEIRRKGPEITFVIEGNGFLYKMCRAIVGTLIQVGSGKIPADDIPDIFESHDRRSAGINAPAHGLVLQKVFYRRSPSLGG